MLDCLIGYVGIKGCGETAPGSGLYVNGLPGIQTELLDKIATSDQITFKGAWADIQKLALQEMLFDIARLLKDRFKIKTLLRSTDMGARINTASQTIASGTYRGYSIDLCKYLPDGYVMSNMVVHNVDDLRLYLPDITVNPVTIKIYDGDLLTELFSYTLEPTNQIAGWNTIPVNRVFIANKLVSVYDATEVNSIELALPASINQSLCSCLGGMYGENCPGEVKGVISDALNITSLTESDNTYGLTTTISLSCSLERFVCGNKRLFAIPLQYLLGSKVMEAALNTHRFGRFNTTDKKQTAALKEDYFSDYLSAMSVVLKGVEMDQSDPCIECDAVIQTHFVHP